MRRLQVPPATSHRAPVLTAGIAGVAAAGDVGARILHWLLDVGHTAAIWLVKGGYRALAEGGSLLLIVSGLSILAIVVPVMLLQGAVAQAHGDDGPRREVKSRRLRKYSASPVPPPQRGREAQGIRHDPQELDRGRAAAGEQTHAMTLAEVLDAVVERGLGEPWILHFDESKTVIRLHGCRTCTDTANADGCAFETGFLHGAFQRVYNEADVVVREIACHGLGHGTCEYEVCH